MLKKMYKNLTFGTTGRYQKLDCGKAWNVLKHKVSSYINAVQSKIKSKIESIVQSRVHSPGFVPTPSIDRYTHACAMKSR